MRFNVLPLSLLLAWAQLTPAMPPNYNSTRNADRASFHGLTSLTEDRSTRNEDPKDKYFHESRLHTHYDGRFASGILTYPARRAHLAALIKTYLSLMHRLGAETWIMHGTLLGWYWNRKIMPWDSDVDVQVSERSIEFLAAYHNMTVHRYALADIDPDAASANASQPGKSDQGRNYLLDINPHYRNTSTTDALNVIDARWIDLSTGLFIDITTLRPNRTAAALGRPGILSCKDGHSYNATDVFPLRDSVFEGVPVKVPYAYAELLVEEYGARALTTTLFEHYRFNAQTKEWVMPEPVTTKALPSWMAWPGSRPWSASKLWLGGTSDGKEST